MRMERMAWGFPLLNRSVIFLVLKLLIPLITIAILLLFHGPNSELLQNLKLACVSMFNKISMRKKIFAGLISLFAIISYCCAQHEYKVVKKYHIASPGGWDYIAVNNGKLYVSHGTQVNILNEETGDSIGYIPNTTGVHGIAFDNELGKGYTSNGRLNTVTVFDLKTNQVLGEISTGQNPDAIMYEPFTKLIITCNGRSKNLSLIDPVAGKTVDSIDV